MKFSDTKLLAGHFHSILVGGPLYVTGFELSMCTNYFRVWTLLGDLFLQVDAK